MTATTTDKSGGAPRPRKQAPPKPAVNGGWWKTLKLSAALFVAVLALMAGQMAAGRDPLLGAGAQQAKNEVATVQRKVVVRRKVIVELQPPPAAAGGGYSAPATGGAVAPSYSAPASAPAPAPVAVAPAPAPAPTTSAS